MLNFLLLDLIDSELAHLDWAFQAEIKIRAVEFMDRILILVIKNSMSSEL